MLSSCRHNTSILCTSMSSRNPTISYLSLHVCFYFSTYGAQVYKYKSMQSMSDGPAHVGNHVGIQSVFRRFASLSLLSTIATLRIHISQV
jgi:hypothetical protein